MKFKYSVDIQAPIDKVVSVFIDPSFRSEYQEGYVDSELLEGEEGQNGAVSKIYFKNNKNEMKLIETIVSNQLPARFEAFYHHKHMDNTHITSFISLDANTTRYTTEGEYIRISWIMPKLLSLLMPSMFSKPAQRWMNNFKALVEKL